VDDTTAPARPIVDPEFAAVIQPLADDELTRLETSILNEGCRDPLVVWHETGILLDGHHRRSICTAHGLPFTTTRVSLPDRRAALVWIANNQLGRRNLTNYQKAELAFVIERNLPEQKRGPKPPGISSQHCDETERPSRAAPQAVGISQGTYDKAKVIAEKAPEPVKQKLRAGETTINAEYERIRREEAKRKVAEQFECCRPPDGKYRCIVIDPPWPIDKIARDVRPNQVAVDYPSMSLDEIRALPVPDLADDGCHVYLWTTHKHLPNALSLFESWGIRYQCLMTWVKNVGMTPFSWMYSTEHVLFGRIGNLDVQRKGLRLDFAAKVREHSRKPDEFFALAAQASPGPRLEMFAREGRDGFEPWGNETGRFS
jgi:N6-adenosine-specific RNA methylase IME4